MGNKICVEIACGEVISYLPASSLESVRCLSRLGRATVINLIGSPEGARRVMQEKGIIHPLQQLSGSLMSRVWNRYCTGDAPTPGMWETLNSPTAVRRWARTYIFQSSWKFPPGYFSISSEDRLLVWILTYISPKVVFHYLPVSDHDTSKSPFSFLLCEPQLNTTI